MKLISKLLLCSSIMVIIVCIWIGIFPGNLKFINEALGASSNIFSYLGMLFAAMALLIACLAFQLSIARPRLRLAIWAWMDDKDNLTLLTNRNTKIVPITRPNTSLHFRLENNGNASARYSVVEIKFNGAFFLATDFEGWDPVCHANAFGYYGFRWSSNDNLIIHPGLPILLPPMYFSGKQIDKPLVLEITIVADGFDKMVYKLPINIEYVDY